MWRSMAPFSPPGGNHTIEGAGKCFTASQGVMDDMRWWLSALHAGLGSNGRAIIPTQRSVSHTAEADAGTEWGIGGLDGARYYNAPLPGH